MNTTIDPDFKAKFVLFLCHPSNMCSLQVMIWFFLISLSQEPSLPGGVEGAFLSLPLPTPCIEIVY